MFGGWTVSGQRQRAKFEREMDQLRDQIDDVKVKVESAFEDVLDLVSEGLLEEARKHLVDASNMIDDLIGLIDKKLEQGRRDDEKARAEDWEEV